MSGLEQEMPPVRATRENFNRLIWLSVRSRRVWEAFKAVDRASFIPVSFAHLQPQAYENSVIDLSTYSMSQPELMAEMVEHLDLTGDENVLEVGTGTTYSTKILSLLARTVHTIEVDEALARDARLQLAKEGAENVTVHEGDGALGLPAYAPYDGIIVWAGVQQLPSALFEQLADGGRMVVPTGFDAHVQSLHVALKTMEGLHGKRVQTVYFQPLMSSADGGWTQEMIEALETVKLRLIEEKLSEQGESPDEVLKSANLTRDDKRILRAFQFSDEEIIAMVKKIRAEEE